MIQALQTWQHWIEECDIVIRTDHETLAGIRKTTNLPRRMQRFVDVLDHFDPTIVGRKGNSNHLADWLSRPSTNKSALPISRYDPVHECTNSTPKTTVTRSRTSNLDRFTIYR